MKRKLIALLALICLLTLPSCKRAPQSSSTTINTDDVTAEQMEEQFGIPVVRVMIDLPNNDGGWRTDHLLKSLEGLPGYNTSFMIFTESLSTETAERESAMTRIKTEMMAGGGPDLFLCGQDTYGFSGVVFGGENNPFFNFPEKAMKNHMLLPMDEYIEKAEYMEWEKFLPVVMEAGRNEEGQQIIPMAYFFEALYLDKEKYGLEDFRRPGTWRELIEHESPAVRNAAYTSTPAYVGRVMEPGADEPIFTEEELLGYMRTREELFQNDAADDGGVDEDSTAYRGCFLRVQDYKPAFEKRPSESPAPDYRIIPARNMRDGVTANIAAFAAINRNARHHELAFRIIDYIMRTEGQQKSSLYASRVLGMPVHMDVGSEELPMDDGWYMNETNFKEYEAARSEITEVRFLGPVDKAVWDIDTFDMGKLDKSVHEQYVLIEMLLAES